MSKYGSSIDSTAQVSPTASIHPSACIDAAAKIDAEARIWHFVHISRQATVGARSSLGQNVFVGEQVTLGKGVKVQNIVSIYKGVEIEDDVFLGPSCVFTNVILPRAFINRSTEFLPTTVQRGASIGANATIVCGNRIGAYAMVGAGSVITHDVPPHALVYGNPARVTGWVCRCGLRLSTESKRSATPIAEVQCATCKESYQLTFDQGRVLACMPHSSR